MMKRTSKATLEDWPSFYERIKERGGVGDEEVDVKQRYERYIVHPDHFIQIARIDERIVGYAWAQNYGPHLRTGKIICRFHDLYIGDNDRHSGLARQLMMDLVQWSKHAGASWLQWNGTPSSQGFYEKLGFTPIPEEEEGYPFYEIEFTNT